MRLHQSLMPFTNISRSLSLPISSVGHALRCIGAMKLFLVNVSGIYEGHFWDRAFSYQCTIPWDLLFSQKMWQETLKMLTAPSAWVLEWLWWVELLADMQWIYSMSKKQTFMVLSHLAGGLFVSMTSLSLPSLCKTFVLFSTLASPLFRELSPFLVDLAISRSTSMNQQVDNLTRKRVQPFVPWGHVSPHFLLAPLLNSVSPALLYPWDCWLSNEVNLLQLAPKPLCQVTLSSLPPGQCGCPIWSKLFQSLFSQRQGWWKSSWFLETSSSLKVFAQSWEIITSRSNHAASIFHNDDNITARNNSFPAVALSTLCSYS